MLRTGVVLCQHQRQHQQREQHQQHQHMTSRQLHLPTLRMLLHSLLDLMTHTRRRFAPIVLETLRWVNVSSLPHATHQRFNEVLEVSKSCDHLERLHLTCPPPPPTTTPTPDRHLICLLLPLQLACSQAYGVQACMLSTLHRGGEEVCLAIVLAQMLAALLLRLGRCPWK